MAYIFTALIYCIFMQICIDPVVDSGDPCIVLILLNQLDEDYDASFVELFNLEKSEIKFNCVRNT